MIDCRNFHLGFKELINFTGENYTKLKSYLFMTKNDSLIAVAYHANSTEMPIFIIQHPVCMSSKIYQKFK